MDVTEKTSKLFTERSKLFTMGGGECKKVTAKKKAASIVFVCGQESDNVHVIMNTSCIMWL